MKIKSDAFKEGEMIPKDYTCEGKNTSPNITFENLPADAKSLALIMEDPDAPNPPFVHWVVWNIDPTNEFLPHLGVEGENSSKNRGYMGPCPPSGEHRYYFKLYALDKKLDLLPNSKKEDLVRAMEGHVLTKAELMGRYKKTL